MEKFNRMSKADLMTGIEQTRKAIEGSRKYLNFLNSGQGLPRDDTARQELFESHTKLIDRMNVVLEELETELSRRAE
jgi:hypothetical protein